MSEQIQEGRAVIHKTDDVFYNSAQVFNRDLSVLAVFVYSIIRERELTSKLEKLAAKRVKKAPLYKGLVVLEALAASGLRSLRYILELDSKIQHITINDRDSAATDAVAHNLTLNMADTHKVQVTCQDANSLMHLWKFSEDPLELSKDARLSPLGGDVSTTTPIGGGSAVSGGVGNTPPGMGNTPPRAPQIMSIDLTNPPTYIRPAPDIIDIDPYGSAAPFIDAAVQSVADGGMLCVTSTDMAVLCGNHSEVSFYRYGGTPLKARYMHEMALRLLIHLLNSSAARYGRACIPLLCASVDFYIRVFVQVRQQTSEVKKHSTNTAQVYQCCQCDWFLVNPLGITTIRVNNHKYSPPRLPDTIKGCCPECESKLWIGGPFYKGPLYQMDFIQNCLDSLKLMPLELKGITQSIKIRGMLTAIKEELFDVPLYYEPPAICGRMRMQVISLRAFKSALLNAGYRVSHFHREPQSVKTDAPAQVVFDIIRTYAKDSPPKNPDTFPLLNKPILTNNIDFTLRLELTDLTPDVPKWLPNKEKYWGPKKKAARLVRNRDAPSATESISQDSTANDNSMSTLEIKDPECPPSKRQCS
eukprot:GHVL01036210.1.p1 GENE.GHVL01036210.1~~GHVL01036210.1.p1  ORF type:complete len:586 (-),score=88.05 GHVL01036210.1:216-1973(-)